MLLSPLFEIPYRWIGKTVFEIKYEYEVSGNASVDLTFTYLALFVTVVLTFITVIVWSVLDRSNKSSYKIFY
ncbi:MAG: hypothetical protein ACI86L_000802 [Dokdonia sp.]|jgi:hypothetical protein